MMNSIGTPTSSTSPKTDVSHGPRIGLRQRCGRRIRVLIIPRDRTGSACRIGVAAGTGPQRIVSAAARLGDAQIGPYRAVGRGRNHSAVPLVESYRLK